LLASRHS